MNRIHMQDQVNNRIEDITNNEFPIKLNEALQNIATLLIVSIFLFLGLSW